MNKKKVKIVIRNEAISLFSENKLHLNMNNQTGFVTSPYLGYVMEARLLAGSTLVHLSLKVNQSNFHIHAKIPGLNFFNVDEKVLVAIDPSQIFVFQQ